MKLVYLVGVIIKKFATMHGHMNVKNRTELQQKEASTAIYEYLFKALSSSASTEERKR